MVWVERRQLLTVQSGNEIEVILNFVCRLAILKKSGTELLKASVNETTFDLLLVMLSHLFTRTYGLKTERILPLVYSTDGAQVN